MPISRITFNGATLLDISNDTVTKNTLVTGYTAHDLAGVQISGRVGLDGMIEQYITTDSDNVLHGQCSIETYPGYKKNNSSAYYSCFGPSYLGYECSYGRRYHITAEDSAARSLKVSVFVFNETAYDAVAGSTSGSNDDCWVYTTAQSLSSSVDFCPPEKINGKSPKFMWLELSYDGPNADSMVLTNIGTIRIASERQLVPIKSGFYVDDDGILYLYYGME